MREELNAIAQLEKKLEDIQKILSSNSDTMITLSRALQFGKTRQTLSPDVSSLQDEDCVNFDMPLIL